MRPGLPAMLWISAAAHAAVLAPAYFAAAPEPPVLAAAPLNVSLSASGERRSALSATPGAIAARPAHSAPASAGADQAAAHAPADAADAPREPGGDSANHLRASLVTQLERYFVYPALARRRGWQGEVAVALRIEPDGRVRALHVARSSGYAVLDRDALATLNRIGVLPRAASWLNGNAYDTEVPVVYRLTEG